MPIINTVIQGGGTTPTGTKQITSNGVHDVTDYASADVQVPTTAPESYRVFEKDSNGVLKNSSSTAWIPLPAGTTDVSSYLFASAYSSVPSSVLNGNIDLSSLTKISGESSFRSTFYGCTGITSVDLSSLTQITKTYACYCMFYGCTGITSVDLSSLSSVTAGGGSYSAAQMFRNCTGITGKLDLSSLKKIDYGMYVCDSMFSGCTGITSIDLSSLYYIGSESGCNYMFSGCTGLTSVILHSLSKIVSYNCCQYMFSSCSNLTSLSFPALYANSFSSYTNQFDYMLRYVTGCTVHFPSNIQSKIGSWSSVTNGFYGTNTTILFDLPATNTLTGADTNTYSRNPKYDTATALAWKVGANGTDNFDPAYYTSGTTDPAVGDTIYSDSACTTAVTTISSIA